MARLTCISMFFLAITTVLGIPSPPVTGKHEAPRCAVRKVRKAWHNFSDAEKKDYLDAEVCLMKTESNLGLRGAQTVFDDLLACHVAQIEVVHFVGAFLPFHRLFMWAHEKKLETECGYTGGQPYWFEPRDVGKFSHSEIFDADLGFGGDGQGETKCVTDGPFAFYSNHIGPGYSVTDQCISRSINDTRSQEATPAETRRCVNEDNWTAAWNCIETVPHITGHEAVGKVMGDTIASPGDPLFYLHHTYLDKLWWEWQAKDLPARLSAMGGQNRIVAGPGLTSRVERPEDVPEPPVNGDPGAETTLGHIIHMYGIVDDKAIKELMDVRDLCYDYEDP